jgi:cystathionine beta-lyase family protein involved in aluminum resistance
MPSIQLKSPFKSVKAPIHLPSAMPGYYMNVQPAGLTFYQIDRDPHQLATVQLAQGKASLTIPYVLSVMGTLNTDYLSED